MEHTDIESYLPRAPIVGATDTARLLGFRTTEALMRARIAGRLPIPMFRLAGRRGWFAATEDIKAWLEDTLNARSDTVKGKKSDTVKGT